MRLLKVMIISLFLAGCPSPSEEVGQVQYYKDNRTNLCFVINRSYGGYLNFTYVPCTPEVERLIK
jgi:hypothetical protein